MRKKKQDALEAAGWRVGDAADFLEMTPAERELLDFRVAIATAIRRQRVAMSLSQQQLGQLIKTTQPRVVKIESAARDVSMDQMLKAFTATGGRIIIKSGSLRTTKADQLVLNLG